MRYAHRIIGANVTVGIGQVCGSILELSQSYSSAREAISYRVLYGTSRAINIQEIAPHERNNPGSSHEGELSHLFKTIRLNEPPEIAQAVHEYLGSISFKEKSLQQHHIDIMELVSALYRFSANNDIAAGGFFGGYADTVWQLLDLGPDALRKWLVDLSLSFREKLISARKQVHEIHCIQSHGIYPQQLFG